MPGGSFNQLFVLTSFGESHGPAIGGVVTGCPSGLKLDMDLLAANLRRRSSGLPTGSGRQETDEVEFLSGVLHGVTTGAPIGFVIRNRDQRPGDYDVIQGLYRSSHADFTYEAKYGLRDHRGGGRSSARETTNWVVGGSLAQMMLQQSGIRIQAVTQSIGPVEIHPRYRFQDPGNDQLGCPDPDASARMQQAIVEARAEGDTLGGTISCCISGVPPGWGEPVFDKLNARLAYAMMSLNAAKGFEIGSGFQATTMKGSDHNDPFFRDADGITHTRTNHSGGIQGGISNGEPIWFRLALKPIASIRKEQTLLHRDGRLATVSLEGRHDVCIVPRALPIVEALAWMVLADFSLLHRSRTP